MSAASPASPASPAALSRLTGEDEFVPERRRWVVAAIMIWVGFNQGMAWMTFSGSTSALRELLSGTTVSDSEVNMLLNWGPIAYLVCIWAFMYRMSSRGQDAVHECVLASAILIFSGCAVRCVPFVHECSGDVWPHVWLHAGQIFVGLGGPVSAAVAPAFAAVWFPARERTLATSLVWACQSAAPSLGFAAALLAGGGRGLRGILLGEALSALGALLCWALAVPRLPRSAPSPSAAAQREAACAAGGQGAGQGFVAELAAALGRHRFWLLAISGGVAVGAFQTWSASLGVIFADHPLKGFGGVDVGILLALVGNAGCFIGTLAAAPLGERCFHRRFKLFLVAASALQVLLLVVFAFTVPGTGHKTSALQLGPMGMLGVLLGASVLNGLSAPICFELGAEITYPAPEGISASVYSVTVNAGGFVLMSLLSAGGDALEGATSCWLMATVVFLGLLLLVPVQEAYPRLSLDEGAEGPCCPLEQ